MGVLQCPICKEFLVGFTWTKTKTGKNWLKGKDDKWHDCPNKKLSKKTASAHKKKNKTGLDIYPKFDSNDAGYYCTKGHFQSTTSPLESHCPLCDTSLSVMMIEREGH